MPESWPRLLRAGLLSGGLPWRDRHTRSYLTISKDLTRVMNRLKPLYRSWAIPCAGTAVYAQRHRSEWLNDNGSRRAPSRPAVLPTARHARHCAEVRRDLLAESRKHSGTKWLRQIPSIGPIRAALLIALIQTPYRFRTKRQLWAYSSLGLETHGSAGYRYQEGQLQRSKKPVALRGLENHNHDLKAIFNSRALPRRATVRLVRSMRLYSPRE